MKDVNTIIHTGCGSHFLNPTFFKIMNEQMIVEKPTSNTLYKSPNIQLFEARRTKAWHGMAILVLSHEVLFVSVLALVLSES